MRFVLVLIFSMITTQAMAEGRPASYKDDEAKTVAIMLASEEPCGITIYSEGMFAWFEERIPADQAVEFLHNVNYLTRIETYKLNEVAGAQRELHCRAVLVQLKEAGWLAE